MSEKRETTKVGAVVVGVDGSPGAGEALRWALAEARLRKVPLRVVHAWSYGYAGAPAGGPDAPPLRLMKTMSCLQLP
jgi:nucleotide-binding universal stress UspA family protein